MIDYDAEDREIQDVQDMLAQHGITSQAFDLRNYAGLTYSELYSLAKAVIKAYTESQKKGEQTA